MKLAVQKNHLGGQILYKSNPVKNGVFVIFLPIKNPIFITIKIIFF